MTFFSNHIKTRTYGEKSISGLKTALRKYMKSIKDIIQHNLRKILFLDVILKKDYMILRDIYSNNFYTPIPIGHGMFTVRFIV